jgi:glucans biosynthesis protein C
MKAHDRQARHHAMDALRGFALLLGVFFHAAESFCPQRFSWAVVDVRAHWIAEFFQHVSHSFRMELFFVMAGFFAPMLLQRHGIAAFVAQRLRRVALPLVLGWLLIVPPLIALWISGNLASGRYPELAAYLQITLPAEAGTLRATWNYYASGAALGAGFTLAHLWFLHQLLVLYLLFLGARSVHGWLAARGVTLIGHADAMLARAAYGGWLLPLLAAAVAVPVYMMGGGVRTATDTLLPAASITATYALCFGLGWLLQRQPGLLPVVGRRWPALLLGGLAMALLTWSQGALFAWAGIGSPRPSWLAALSSLAYGLMMWSFALGFIGLFQRCIRREQPGWRYLADASYWIYLVHLPLVVALQRLLWDVELHGGLKYLAILAVSLPLLVLSYHYLVRATAVGALLNGRRRPRAWTTTAVRPAHG